MPRPQRRRSVCCEPDYVFFAPDGISPQSEVTLTVDEYEVIRLVDFEKKTHEEAAKQMNISRTTVTEIYESARYKLADTIVNGKRLFISGGNYSLCSGAKDCCHGRSCQRSKTLFKEADIDKKGENIMRIAVTYDNGEVFQHFGHTEAFKIYDVEERKIVKEMIAPTFGSGHGALAGFLRENGVDVLICGGIGGGAQLALGQAGIKLYGGVSGSADEAVKAFLAGNLGYNPDVHCDHHDHEHGEGEHSCGEHGCGSHDCGSNGCH